MAVVLALLTSAMFGIGDFCGGLAAQRARVVQVLAGSHFVGAVGATVAALVIGDAFIGRDVLFGLAGGAFGVCGVGLLYRRLAIGPMSVVAPLTAMTSAVVPAAWGILRGERLSVAGWIGLVVALLAVLLVSMSGDDRATSSPAVTGPVIVESLLAGAGFGVMFIFFGSTSGDSGPWPIASARLLTMSLLIIVVLVVSARSGEPAIPADRQGWVLIAAVGILDTTSNITFLYASGLGQLAVVAVLSSLYPVSTVILAAVLLSERPSSGQLVGFAAAMAATVLFSLP